MARGARPRRRDIFPIGYTDAAAPAAGGAALLEGEANGFAADFTYATDASRVATKAANVITYSGTSFFTSSGTSSKWVYDATGTLVNVPVGTLPLDYDPVTHAAKGLLCEPAATNLCLQSQTFNVGSWAANALTVTANAIAAPDGTVTAEAFIPPTGAPSSYITQGMTVTNAAAYTLSFYIKNGTLGTSWFLAQIDSGGNKSAWFNYSTGVKGSLAGGTTSSNMIAVGNGWYRCDVTFTAGATSAQPYLALSDSDGGGAGTVLGDGVRPAFYLWGAQLEAGTIATSYIPTTSATVTRAADKYSCTPASIGYSATAGSWWVEVQMLTKGSVARVIGYTTGSFTPLFQDTDDFKCYENVILSKTVTGMIGTHKIAIGFAATARELTADGLAPASELVTGSGLLSPGTTIGFGCSPPGTDQINGYIRKLYYLPRRMPNAELQTETAL